MTEKPRHRLRFSLRTLLVVVAVCAVSVFAYQVFDRYAIYLVGQGMTAEPVRSLLGEPHYFLHGTQGTHETWGYFDDSAGYSLEFDNGACVGPATEMIRVR